MWAWNGLNYQLLCVFMDIKPKVACATRLDHHKFMGTIPHCRAHGRRLGGGRGWENRWLLGKHLTAAMPTTNWITFWKRNISGLLISSVRELSGCWVLFLAYFDYLNALCCTRGEAKMKWYLWPLDLRYQVWALSLWFSQLKNPNTPLSAHLGFISKQLIVLWRTSDRGKET